MHEGDETPGHAPPNTLFLSGLALLLLVLTFVLARPFLGAIVLALLFSFLLHRPFESLVRLVRLRSLAAGIMLILFAAAVFGPVAFIVTHLAQDAGIVVELARDPQRVEAALARALAPFGIERSQVADLVAQAVERVAGLLQGALLGLLASAVHLLTALLVFFFLLFFGLRDGGRAYRALRRLIPLRKPAKDHLLALVGQRTRAIALGAFLVGLVQGVAGGLGWWFFGFPAPVFWGFVITVFAVLPFGPPFFIMAPAGIIALLNGDWFAGIGMLVWAGVIVGVVDDLLRPYLIGKRSGVHPAVILVGTLGGLFVFGVAGFLIGPLLLSMVGPVLQVWAQERRAEEEEDAAGEEPDAAPAA